MIRPKTAVFAFIGVMMIYVVTHNERFLIDPDSPAWDHYSKLGWPLLFHGVAGACAVLLAPLQFSDRLRKRFTKMHRVVGRIYCIGAFILAPLGVYIQYLDEALGETRTFTIATAVDATLLFTTTAIALYFAMRRRITQHRQWMTRSYACALIFFEVRFFLGVTGWGRFPHAAETAVWTFVGLSLLVADIANQVTESRTGRAAAPRPQPAAFADVV